MRIDGTWTALVTPFAADGNVDWDGLKKNVEFQIAQGVTGVLPVGTTGESPTLGWEEHNEVIDQVVRQCSGRCGVLAGTGSNSTEEALKSTEHAVKSGADAVLMVDCYYNGPSSQELRDEYYAVVAEAFKSASIVPYVIPGRSGTSLSVEDLALLAAKYPNVATVKEATGDLDRMAKTRKLLGADFSIMSGDDDITFKIMSDSAIKADGVISVMTNVVPGAIAKMVNALNAGDISAAEAIRDSIAPLLAIVTVKTDNPRTMPDGSTAIVNDRYRNPLPVKVLMAGLGMPSGACRKPLGKMTAAGVETVRSAVRTVLQSCPEVLAPIGEFYGLDIAGRVADDAVWASLAK